MLTTKKPLDIIDVSFSIGEGNRGCQWLTRTEVCGSQRQPEMACFRTSSSIPKTNEDRNCFKSDKIAEISYASQSALRPHALFHSKMLTQNFTAIQGKDCLVQKFRNSSVMLEASHYRPKVTIACPHGKWRSWMLLKGRSSTSPVMALVLSWQGKRNHFQIRTTNPK
jgi:hypothetical protein